MRLGDAYPVAGNDPLKIPAGNLSGITPHGSVKVMHGKRIRLAKGGTHSLSVPNHQENRDPRDP